MLIFPAIQGFTGIVHRSIIAASSFVEVMSVEQYNIDGIYKLLAATVRRAIHDARRGDEQAIRWLKRFLDGVKC